MNVNVPLSRAVCAECIIKDGESTETPASSCRELGTIIRVPSHGRVLAVNVDARILLKVSGGETPATLARIHTRRSGSAIIPKKPPLPKKKFANGVNSMNDVDEHGARASIRPYMKRTLRNITAYATSVDADPRLAGRACWLSTTTIRQERSAVYCAVRATRVSAASRMTLTYCSRLPHTSKTVKLIDDDSDCITPGALRRLAANQGEAA